MNCNFNELNVKLNLWDNSTQSMLESELDQIRYNISNFYYTHSPENTPLSIVYNSIISGIKNPDVYILLLDDDTKLNPDFFQQLLKIIPKNNKIELFLPKVFNHDRLVSPAFDFTLFSKSLPKNSEGKFKSNFLTAINSGMVISNKLFQDGFRYDESLAFYGTDNFLMDYFQKRYRTLYILPIEFSHDLSFGSSSIPRKLEIHFEIKRAMFFIYRKRYFRLFLFRINFFIVSIKRFISTGERGFLISIKKRHKCQEK
jgi:GT2 family glycosyltransferase